MEQRDPILPTSLAPILPTIAQKVASPAVQFVLGCSAALATFPQGRQVLSDLVWD